MSIKTEGREQALGQINQSFAMLESVQNANSCDWIELSSDVDTDILNEAARMTIARHPMAQSVYRRRWLSLAWVHTKDQLPVIVERVSWPSDDDADVRKRMFSIIEEYSVFSEDRHPFRFVVISTPSRFFLQILTTHVYTDGRSANIFTNDLMECYNSLLDGRQWKGESVDISERNHDRMFLSGLSKEQRCLYFLRAVGSVVRDLVAPAGRLELPKSRRCSTGLLVTQISPELMQKVKNAAKARGVTVHSFFLLGLVRTFARYNRNIAGKVPRKIRLLDNFSLRRFSDESVIDELYDCVAVPYVLEADSRGADEDILSSFHEQLDRMKRGKALSELYKYKIYRWLSMLLPMKLAARVAANVMVRANIICTNVGILNSNLKNFGGAKVLSYVSFPALLPPGDMLFQFSSFQGRLRLLTLYHPDQMSEASVKASILAVFVNELERVAKERAFGNAKETERGYAGCGGNIQEYHYEKR